MRLERANQSRSEHHLTAPFLTVPFPFTPLTLLSPRPHCTLKTDSRSEDTPIFRSPVGLLLDRRQDVALTNFAAHHFVDQSPLGLDSPARIHSYSFRTFVSFLSSLVYFTLQYYTPLARRLQRRPCSASVSADTLHSLPMTSTVQPSSAVLTTRLSQHATIRSNSLQAHV